MAAAAVAAAAAASSSPRTLGLELEGLVWVSGSLQWQTASLLSPSLFIHLFLLSFHYCWRVVLDIHDWLGVSGSGIGYWRRHSGSDVLWLFSLIFFLS
jgi:hypothetical protein